MAWSRAVITAIPLGGPWELPKSVLKTSLKPFPNSPASPDREECASPKVEKEKAPMRTLAATTCLMTEDTDQEQLEQDREVRADTYEERSREHPFLRENFVATTGSRRRQKWRGNRQSRALEGYVGQ